MLSDGGVDLRNVAHHLNTSYLHENRMFDQGHRGLGQQWLDLSQKGPEHMARLHRVARLCQPAQWMMMVEDDVMCHARAQTCPRADGNGMATTNVPFSSQFREYVVGKVGAFKSTDDFQFAMGGGSIMRVDSLLQVHVSKQDIQAWERLDDRIGYAGDVMLTAAFLLHNFSVASWPDSVQGATGAAFEHGAKQWYVSPENQSCSAQEFFEGRWSVTSAARSHNLSSERNEQPRQVANKIAHRYTKRLAPSTPTTPNHGDPVPYMWVPHKPSCFVYAL
jgi:hypothetical protein